MCLSEETRTKLTDICIYYGLDWYDSKSGIVIDSGDELWILKMKKGASGGVRGLYHQNHGRTDGKKKELPCLNDMIYNDILQKYFHKQDWDATEIKKNLKYVYNHAHARRELNARRRYVLDGTITNNAKGGVAYGY